MNDFYKKNKKTISGLLIVIFSLAFFGYANAVWAGPIDAAVTMVIGWVASLIILVCGWILGLAISAILTIVSYNKFVSEVSIVQAWVIVRDLCNMFFILILLMVAFSTILRIESYQWKKILPKLLIMAVLINFSKTICGLLIDFSQVIMLTFVNAFSDSGGNFVKMLGVEKFLSLAKSQSSFWGLTEGTLNLTNTVAAMMFAIILMVVATVAMMAIMIIFLMRMIMLWIYVILSPFAFLLMAFPAGQKYASQWWSEFIKYLINGPILAFFIWLALIVTSNPPPFDNSIFFDPKTGTLQSVNNQLIMALQSPTFINFILAIGLLVGGLMISQQIGGLGASWGMSALGNLKNKGLKGVAGVPLAIGKFGFFKAGRMADTLQMKGQGAIAKGLSKLTGGLYGEKYQAKSLNYRMIKEGWDRNQAAKMRKYEGTKAGAWQDQFNRTLSASAGIPIVSRVIRKRAEDKIIKNQGEIAKAEKLIEEDKQKLKDETLTSKERIDIEARIKVNDDEINKFKKENRELANVTARWGTKPPQKYARLQEQERANEKYNDIRKEDLNEEGLVHNYINEGAMDKKRAYLMHLADINGINTLFDAKGIEMTSENISEFFKKEFGESAGDVAAEVSRRAEAVGNHKVMGFHKYDVTQGRNVVASPEEQKVFSMRKDNEKYAQNHARTTHFDSLVDRTKDGPKLSELGVEQLLHIASSTGRMKEINNGNYQTRYGEMVVKLEADINNKAKEFESQGRQTDADALRKVLAAFKENYGILGKKEKNIKSEASNDKKSDKGPVLYDAYNRPIKKNDEPSGD